MTSPALPPTAATPSDAKAEVLPMLEKDPTGGAVESNSIQGSIFSNLDILDSLIGSAEQALGVLGRALEPVQAANPDTETPDEDTPISNCQISHRIIVAASKVQLLRNEIDQINERLNIG